MKKFALVLAAVAALALGTFTASQPAKADPTGGWLVAGGLGWGYCHVTYGKKRQTPFCAWHDAWHKTYWKKK